MSWELKRTAQCNKCPWRKGVDPHDIPNGYSEEKHKALACTIADPGSMRLTNSVMACHETHNAHCIGWLMNQLGPGNNIPLRIRMMTCSNSSDIRLNGDQYETFDETLPRRSRRCA